MQRTTTRRRRLRPVLSAAVGLAVLAAGPAAAAQGPDERVLTVAGHPLVHEFALDDPGDAVTGWWQVHGRSATPVPFEGVLAADPSSSGSLARALVVHYGAVGPDGDVVTWHPAGTLAEPATYSAALARVPSAAAGAPVSIPVRVSLPDPGLVSGLPGEALVVEATFTVTYLNPGGRDDAPSGPGLLAVTGAGAWPAALLAGVSIGLGLLLRRRWRAARSGGDPASGLGPRS